MHEHLTIAHISDLHIAGTGDRRQLDDLERMLEHFNRQGYDHLIISGDLSDRASAADWEILRSRLEKHGWYHWERTTLISGNHDLISLEEEMRFYNLLNPLPGYRERAITTRAERFCSFFKELVIGDGPGRPDYPFLKIMRHREADLAIAGFNSVWPWSPTENPMGARGYVRPDELQGMLSPEALSAIEGCFVVGLLHHAPKVYGTDSLIDQAYDWTMELRNRDEFLVLMQRLGASVVLHGHFHRFQSYRMGGISFINGGSFRYAPERYSVLEVLGPKEFRQRFEVVPAK